uniref:Uncharacterized protein n=1 Tax=Piliocolobus tephrosceles TaxID=591936 RepID=A0A8C9IE85_9PRIM
TNDKLFFGSGTQLSVLGM